MKMNNLRIIVRGFVIFIFFLYLLCLYLISHLYHVIVIKIETHDGDDNAVVHDDDSAAASDDNDTDDGMPPLVRYPLIRHIFIREEGQNVDSRNHQHHFVITDW